MKEEKYFLDFSKTIRKCIIMYEVKGSVHSPIMYIKKPKWRSEEEFVEFVKSLHIYVTKKP